jgi:protein involved in polysaccharide export with SLBB domain
MTRFARTEEIRTRRHRSTAACILLPAAILLASCTTAMQAQMPLLPPTSTDISSQAQSIDQRPQGIGEDLGQDALSDPSASGSTGDGAFTGGATSLTAPRPVQTTALSADAIVSFLEQNPDVTVELKELAADRIREQGGEADENSISDQQLYEQIAVNPSLRASITTFLRARGYEIEDSASSTADAAGMDAQSRLDIRSMQAAGAGQAFPSGQLGTNTSGYASGSSRQGESRISPRATKDGAQPPSSTDIPRALHRPTPYNLRSMRDLYTQVPDQYIPLSRFGSEFFLPQNRRAGAASTSNTASSLNVPVGPDYILGPGDTLSIELWGGATLSFSRAVERDGRILLPEAGSVQIAGLSLEHAETVIAEKLKQQYRNAQIAVTMARLRSVHVYVTGDVQRPGAYEISALATPLNALYAAGGPTASGSLRMARHMRGEKLIEEIDLYNFFLHGIHVGGAHFESNDTLLIPPAGPQVSITGAVRRPAVYELKAGEQSLASVLEDAGGLLPSASLNHVIVERIVPGRDREILTLEPKKAEISETLAERAKSFAVQDGDRVRIDPVLPYSERVVYLDGHVARPSRIAYHDGMRLSDALHSYRDMLPEPAARAEILRLVPPDMHAEAIAFDLPGVLIGNGDLPLQPFDTIRVHSRYEADAPRVTISGEVLHPGMYPLSEGMTAAQLVRMAGGFKRDAYIDQAELTSYEVGDGNVTGRLRSLAIGAAVHGSDPGADVVLQPGDILSIRQLTGWEDVGESIRIEGQVRYPGTYGFKDGERLSSVLRRAGGLLPTAYPMGAILVREQVRELEQKSREELIRQIQANSAAARLSPSLGQQDTGATLQLIQSQQEQVLADLKNHPPAGRMVIHITADIDSWANSPGDVELRRGDVLTIPKQPGFVLATGQVYNATALTYTADKTAGWYLSHAGGTNTIADRKEIFIIRANGSVIGRHSGHWLGGDVLSTRMNPGDVIVVPQKIIGHSLLWRNLLTTAQLASSIAITAAVAAI